MSRIPNSFFSLLEPVKVADTCAIQIDEITTCLRNNEKMYVSRLQYSVQLFCLSKKYGQKEAKILDRLLDLCFSNVCISCTTDITVFVGCVAAAADYLALMKSYKRVSEVCNLLKQKDKEIHAKANLNHNLKAAGIRLLKNGCDLLQTNVEGGLSLINSAFIPLSMMTPDSCVGKQVAGWIRVMSFKLKRLNHDGLEDIFLEYKKVQNVLEGSEKSCEVLEFFVERLYYSTTSQIVDHNKCMEELNIILLLMEERKSVRMWETVLSFFTCKKKRNVVISQECVSLIMQILKTAKCDKANIISLLLIFYCSNVWLPVEDTPPDVIVLLFNQYLMFLETECKGVNTNESNDKKIYHVFNLLLLGYNTTLFICRNHFKIKSQGWRNLANISHLLFEICRDCFVKDEDNCDEFADHWTSFTIHIFNSLLDLINNCENKSDYTLYRNFCINVIPYIVTTKRTLPFSTNQFPGLFSKWRTACEKLGDWTGVVRLKAFQALFCRETSVEALMDWYDVKQKNAVGDQAENFAEYLTREEAQLKILYPAFDMSTIDIKVILLAELEAYGMAKSGDMKRTVLTLWAKLKKLEPTIFEWAFAYSNAIQILDPTDESVLTIFKRQGDKITTVLQANKKSSSKATVCRSTFYDGLVKLSFLIWRMRKKDLNEDPLRSQAQAALEMEELEKGKHGEAVDLNVTCDLAPTGCAVTVASEGDIVKSLLEVVEIWQDVSGLWSEDVFSRKEVSIFLEQLHLIGELLTIYDSPVNGIKAWTLFYDIAVKVEDQVQQLIALSLLIERAQISSDSPVHAKAKEIADAIEKRNKKNYNSDVEALIIFYLAEADVLIKEGNHLESTKHLTKCRELIGSLRTKSFHMLKGRYFCFVSKIMVLCHGAPFPFESENVRYVTYNAFRYFVAALNNRKEEKVDSILSYSLLVYTLDVVLWCVDVFSFFYLPRMVRALVDQLYTIFQELSITSRTAQMLTILIETDLQMERIDAAFVKLSNLQTLLQLPSDEKIKPQEDDNSNDVNLEISPIRMCRRDVPTDHSPLLNFSPVVGSNISWKHSDSCTCHTCRSFILKTTLLKSKLLKAACFTLADKRSNAVVIYETCEDSIGKCEPFYLHQSILNELSKFFVVERVNYKYQEFVALKAAFYMAYSVCLLHPDLKKSKEVETKLELAETYVNKLTTNNHLMEWTLVELQICSYSLKNRQNSKQVQEIKAVQYLKPPINILTKTPKVTKVISDCMAPKRLELVSTPCPPRRPAMRPRKVFGEEIPTKSIFPEKQLQTPIREPGPLTTQMKSVKIQSKKENATPKSWRRIKVYCESSSESSKNEEEEPPPVSTARRRGRPKLTEASNKKLEFDNCASKRKETKENDVPVLKIINNDNEKSPEIKTEIKRRVRRKVVEDGRKLDFDSLASEEKKNVTNENQKKKTNDINQSSKRNNVNSQNKTSKKEEKKIADKCIPKVSDVKEANKMDVSDLIESPEVVTEVKRKVRKPVAKTGRVLELDGKDNSENHSKAKAGSSYKEMDNLVRQTRRLAIQQKQNQNKREIIPESDVDDDSYSQNNDVSKDLFASFEEQMKS